MTLLIDLGNTRLKWATLKADGTLKAQQALSHADWQSKDFEQALAKAVRPTAAIWVVSVSAASTRAKLRRALRALTDQRPHFIETTAECAGVRNGYREPWRLGADRWVALIGARARVPRRTVLVVDVGTALTLDVLRADGRHAGGVIVPGVDLMQQSLLRSTGGIRQRAGSPRSGSAVRAVSWQACSTREAIHHGAQLASAALIDAAYAEHRALRPRLLLTGGGAKAVQRLVKSPSDCVPDLVLQGVAQVIRAKLGDQG